MMVGSGLISLGEVLNLHVVFVSNSTLKHYRYPFCWVPDSFVPRENLVGMESASVGRRSFGTFQSFLCSCTDMFPLAIG